MLVAEKATKNGGHHGRGQSLSYTPYIQHWIASVHIHDCVFVSSVLSRIASYAVQRRLSVLQIKQKAKGTMQGPNGSLVPGPGGNHQSAQNNQNVDNDFSSGNMGRGFDQNNGMAQGNLGQGFDNSGPGYGTGTRPVLEVYNLCCASTLVFVSLLCC